MRITQASLIAASILLQPSHAAPLTEDYVRDWWKAETQASQSLAPFHGMKVSWVSYVEHIPSPEYLKQLRERVEGKPDHPDRSLLLNLENRANDADEQYYTAWIIDDEHWRLEYNESPGKTVRAWARNGDLAWDGSRIMLRIVDRRGSYPVAAEKLFTRNQQLNSLAEFAYQGANRPSLQSGTITNNNIVLSGARSVALTWFHQIAGVRWDISASLLDEHESLYINNYQYDSGSEIINIFYLKPKFNDSAGRWISHYIIKEANNFRHSRSYKLLEIAALKNPNEVDLSVPAVEDLPGFPHGWLQRDIATTVKDYRKIAISDMPAHTIIVADSNATDPTKRYATAGEAKHKPKSFPTIIAVGVALAGIVFLFIRIRSRP